MVMDPSEMVIARSWVADAMAATATADVLLVQGSVDVSRQLVDRADSSFDTAMAAELGASLGEQLDIATVFVREWRYLEGERCEQFVAERRRYEGRIRDLFRDGVEGSQLRTDLDVATAALLFLSAANWAYTWLRPGADTAALADRLFAAMLDGMRGYATP